MARATRILRIVNEMGVHARPATQIVELTNTFRSDIRLANGEEEVDAKSIFGVMMLAAVQGTELRLTADGDDAEEAAEALEKLVASGFGETGAGGPSGEDGGSTMAGRANEAGSSSAAEPAGGASP